MMPTIMFIEKADPIEGILTLVVFKARPAGSMQGDRDDEGLDPVSACKALQEWTANFGTTIVYTSPITGRQEYKWCGLYDSHGATMKADLLGSWFFPDEGKYRIIVRPHNKAIALDAQKGLITGSSWAGSVAAYTVDDETGEPVDPI